ncbi:uncharacterized protein PHALS_12016 [Plasmopara halstedii]|uniref:Uncharacterized protein n=1 Tax=Plasmopara halstedii TaxID=4781 RepID=A0A0P1AKN8_PLAHL|nr:uncharacterized protein PHALS_12016 [Plasmopara halstedii]CEG41682.1 hypothetical protein PHALS_12016 [Plasmopara halstedii]|eukprot:XP_024578051.1 hypothetical protein PHALS_12016 [Plasmopara halstedii]
MFVQVSTSDNLNLLRAPSEVLHQQSPFRFTITFRRRVRQATEVTVDIQLLSESLSANFGIMGNTHAIGT